MDHEQAKIFKDKGNQAFSAKNYKEAIEHYTTAISLYPEDPVFYSNRSACHANLQEYQEALENAEIAVALNPNFVRGYTRKGLAEYHLDKTDEAEESYKKALELDPTNADAKEWLERIEKERTEIPGSDIDTQNLIIKLLSNPKTEKYMREAEFAKKILDITVNPDNQEAYMQEDPRIKEAFEIYAEDFDEEPEKPIAEVKNFEEAKKAGNEAFGRKEYAEAICYYDKAIEFDPNDYIVHNNKATVYFEMKKLARAMLEADMALEIYNTINKPDSVKLAKIYCRKGKIYDEWEEFERSVENYELSLKAEKDPTVEDLLKKAQVALEKQKKAEAEKQPENVEKQPGK